MYENWPDKYYVDMTFPEAKDPKDPIANTGLFIGYLDIFTDIKEGEVALDNPEKAYGIVHALGTSAEGIAQILWETCEKLNQSDHPNSLSRIIDLVAVMDSILESLEDHVFNHIEPSLKRHTEESEDPWVGYSRTIDYLPQLRKKYLGQLEHIFRQFAVAYKLEVERPEPIEDPILLRIVVTDMEVELEMERGTAYARLNRSGLRKERKDGKVVLSKSEADSFIMDIKIEKGFIDPYAK